MSAGIAGGEMISERLHESLARLREDIERVEMWAGALEGFALPIPDYEAARQYQLSPDGDSAAEKNAAPLPKETDGTDGVQNAGPATVAAAAKNR